MNDIQEREADGRQRLKRVVTITFTVECEDDTENGAAVAVQCNVVHDPPITDEGVSASSCIASLISTSVHDTFLAAADKQTEEKETEEVIH